jgi:hypothetical protein
MFGGPFPGAEVTRRKGHDWGRETGACARQEGCTPLVGCVTQARVF